MKNIVKTAAKGFCMGSMDIVPGVSGSTVAVLLGFYERFIAALKNIDLKLIKAVFGPIRHGFSKESRAEFVKTCREKDIPWLLNLAVGIGCAGVLASYVITWLLANYPDITRGFFFGLVLGSAIQPIVTLKKPKITEIAIIIIFAAACFIGLGQSIEPPVNYITVIAGDGAALKEVCSSLPSLYTPEQIVRMPQNAGLLAQAPELASMSPDAVSAFSLKAGTEVVLPVMPLYYAFISGFCAICAMLLPGISGSFVLLVLGGYYCALGAARGFVSSLTHGSFATEHFCVLALLALGAVTGMAVFSRVLTWLFNKYRRGTLAAIVGILLGCLRAVWPFRAEQGDTSVNVLPGLDFPHLGFIILASVIAIGIVVTTLVVQKKAEA